MKNLYNILEIHTNASSSEIKKAYRTLAKKYHPDVNPKDTSLPERFREITEAYNILMDEKLKKEYDQKLFNEEQVKQKTQHSSKMKEQMKNKKRTDNLNVNFEFENFFGFDPKTKEMKKDFGNQNKKNPMDTTNIFDSFFKVKRK
ncbi:J domain-containing protein [Anaerophilus nitritogenes]|uniref:J domain-containing protein n=1 Tax=Anaerophilus nitritogenes TaxID=2498136 RepID=UPI00101D9ED7|nr:DnaJ domain-containing protein [Anaerophilus nitritogenes]